MHKRYKHILLPLDGSNLAEAALPDAIALAHLSEAEITLLQVVSRIDEVVMMGEHAVLIDEQWERKQEHALEYLDTMCQRLEGENLPAHKAVEMGSAAESIIDYAHQHSVDLIVMATHGRSGLQRWLLGSVADKVLRGAELPILLIRASDKV